MDADTATVGDQAFRFIRTNDFTGAGGEVRVKQGAAATYVQADVDGDGVADLSIRVDTSFALNGADFML